MRTRKAGSARLNRYGKHIEINVSGTNQKSWLMLAGYIHQRLNTMIWLPVRIVI